MREAWFCFWNGGPKALNDPRPWSLFYYERGFASWNDGGRYFNWVLFAPGMLAGHGKRALRVYLAGKVFWLPPWRNPKTTKHPHAS